MQKVVGSNPISRFYARPGGCSHGAGPSTGRRRRRKSGVARAADVEPRAPRGPDGLGLVGVDRLGGRAPAGNGRRLCLPLQHRRGRRSARVERRGQALGRARAVRDRLLRAGLGRRRPGADPPRCRRGERASWRPAAARHRPGRGARGAQPGALLPRCSRDRRVRRGRRRARDALRRGVQHRHAAGGRSAPRREAARGARAPNARGAQPLRDRSTGAMSRPSPAWGSGAQWQSRARSSCSNPRASARVPAEALLEVLVGEGALLAEGGQHLLEDQRHRPVAH